MKKQILIRVVMVAMIVVAAFFVVAAVRTNNKVSAATEECSQDNKDECLETKSHSEFLLESITRHLLSR